MRLSPKCKVCGDEMQLDDEETRRWYCRNDRLAFTAKEGGWIQKESPTDSPDLKPTPSPSTKSNLTGLAVNFLLPGGGVIYAGSKIGWVYPVISVVFLFLAWPFAIVIVAISYIHTVLAINEKNNEVRKVGPIAPKMKQSDPPRQLLPQVGAGTFCTKCGSNLKSVSIHCPRCGSHVIETDSTSNSEKTRLYG